MRLKSIISSLKMLKRGIAKSNSLIGNSGNSPKASDSFCKTKLIASKGTFEILSVDLGLF